MQLFIYYKGDGYFWLRFKGGRGLSVIDRHKHAPLFSVRNGYTKEWRWGRWAINLI